MARPLGSPQSGGHHPQVRYVVYNEALGGYFQRAARVKKWDRPSRDDKWGDLQVARVFTGKSAPSSILRAFPGSSLVEVRLMVPIFA